MFRLFEFDISLQKNYRNKQVIRPIKEKNSRITKMLIRIFIKYLSLKIFKENSVFKLKKLHYNRFIRFGATNRHGGQLLINKKQSKVSPLLGTGLLWEGFWYPSFILRRLKRQILSKNYYDVIKKIVKKTHFKKQNRCQK